MLLATIVVATMAVAACGGGDDNDGSSPAPESTPTATAPDETGEPTQSEQAADDSDQAAVEQVALASVEEEEAAEAEEPDVDEAVVEEAEPPRLPLPYDNERALAVLRTLTVEIGPRVQGTASDRAAADLLAEAFASFGYRVERQSFSVPTFGVDHLEVAVAGEPIEASAFTFTAGGEVDGPLVAVPGLGSESDFALVDVSGAIALIERGVLFFQEKVGNAEAAGAIGVIIYNNEPGPFEGALQDGSLIPAVSVSGATGLTLVAATSADAVAASILIEGGGLTTEAQNVIARPSEGPCRIYVGGHYDTVPGVSGANDNASGTALVVELARAFAGTAADELVCFVGFGGEEGVNGSSGLSGSRALVTDLEERGLADDVTAMLNLDVSSAGTTLLLVGTPSLRNLTRAIADALGIVTAAGGLPPGTGSDHLSFAAVGIPVIFPTMSGARIHEPADNFDSVQPETLERMGRLAHATLQCLIVRAGGDLPAPDGCVSEPSGGSRR